MLTRILLAAILAGVLSGVFYTAVQAFRVTPLILEAETYENSGVASKPHDEAGDKKVADEGKVAAHSHEAGEELTAHHHDEEVWAPDDGIERTLFTMLANILVGVSYALLLTGGVLITKSVLTVKSGLVWGLCGFVVFVLAPNFGLSPELPGMDAADLTQRQTWWFVTVVATAAALAIFAFKQKIFWMLGGLALLVAPHIYGAPVPVVHESVVPANLAAEFVMATIVTSLLFWLVLGGLLGFLVQRVTAEFSNAQTTPEEG